MNRQYKPRIVLVLVLALLVMSTCAAPPTPPVATRPPDTAAPVPATPTSVAPAATSAPTAAAGVTVTWFGQSMFTLKFPNGPLAVTDPVGASVGYKVTPVSGVDVVTISHEHQDHTNMALVPGSPKILRGLANDDWAKVDETVQGVRIRTVGVYHDDAQGAQRGKNSVFIFEASGLKIVHLGDLGHLLSTEQVSAIGPVDVLMLPVGGNYTIDASKASQVVDALNPRAVIPMHYKTPPTSLPIATVDAFLTGKTVERVSGNKLTISAATLPKSTTVYLLGYE